MRTMVIAVDGGSRGNNRNDPKSQAAYGVFFGPNCHRNTYGLVPQSAPQTSSRAELEAVRKALELVQGMKQAGEIEDWREIIIKLDSDYVAKSLGEYVWTWERNGYMTRKGTPVEHAGLIRELHGTITRLEQNGAVPFWSFVGEWNREADALVNQALDVSLIESQHLFGILSAPLSPSQLFQCLRHNRMRLTVVMRTREGTGTCDFGMDALSKGSFRIVREAGTAFRCPGGC